jgi:hypothetical protein
MTATLNVGPETRTPGATQPRTGPNDSGPSARPDGKGRPNARALGPDRSCDAPRHDATGYQRYHCRCSAGRAAQRLYNKRRELERLRGDLPRRVPKTGTTRRVRALARIGWSMVDIERTAGLSAGMLSAGVLSKSKNRASVARATHLAVAAVYNSLWDKPGPSAWVRNHAARQGWPPPLAWDDDTIDDPDAQPYDTGDGPTEIDHVVVDRLVSGERLSATPAEKREAVKRLVVDGVPFSTACRRMGTDFCWSPQNPLALKGTGRRQGAA